MRPRGSEVGRLISDNSKAARLMGWKPGVGVDEGLERAIAFVRDNLNLYRPQTYTV